MVKIPTLDDFQRFDGAHCKLLWAEVGPDYVCPACRRSKFQIFRWTVRFPNKPNRFEDWIAVLHRHHDHATNVWRCGWGHGAASGKNPPPRFPDTVICDQCNSSDGTAKRRLALPKDFSFAPWEIAQFVTPTPHGQHMLDLEAARRIYQAIAGGLMPGAAPHLVGQTAHQVAQAVPLPPLPVPPTQPSSLPPLPPLPGSAFPGR